MLRSPMLGGVGLVTSIQVTLVLGSAVLKSVVLRSVV
jgi:hypothetical protein